MVPLGISLSSRPVQTPTPTDRPVHRTIGPLASTHPLYQRCNILRQESSKLAPTRSTSPYRPLTRPRTSSTHAESSSSGNSLNVHTGGGRTRSPSMALAYEDKLHGAGSSSSPVSLAAIRLRLHRPSFRLKAALIFLSTGIIVLILLALNLITLDPTATPSTNTKPVDQAIADSGSAQTVAEGKDAHIEEQEIQRSFEEPDFALLSSKQPSEIGCDVPISKLDGRIVNPDEEGVLVFLGVFSAADKKDRRDLYRKVYFPDFPPSLVTTKFILGTPPYPARPVGQEAAARSLLLRELDKEQAEHGDMVMLPMVDNIDLGKTHEYFKWVAKEYGGAGRVKGRPRFVMKADDDTILVMPNVISAFKDLNCSKNVYWGTTAGKSNYFGEYMRGLAYAMSWPLVSWIGNADMPLAHIVKIEDARTGQWLRHLDPVTDPVQRIDMGWMMGDWNQLDVSTATVGLHWCKLDEWVKEQHRRIISLWHAANRSYEWDQGVEPSVSIEKGKQTPEEAAKEHQRQKDLGWDVNDTL